MAYSDNIKHYYLKAETADFPAMVDALLAQVSGDNAVLRLIFFGGSADNREYEQRQMVLRKKVGLKFSAGQPALSFVAQQPLDCPLLLEVHSYLPGKDDRIAYGISDDTSYTILENQAGRFLYAGGFQGNVSELSIDRQAGEAFSQIGRLLDKEGFPLNSIVRQWNYIERITACYDGGQHYQLFNNARAAFYKETGWPLGYPAATGIGTDLGGVLIDFDAVELKCADDKITPIDNRLQIAAHTYSGQVLKKAPGGHETPKFVRGKSLTISGKPLVYISGTAAIRGEESLDNAGIEKQLRITMENIAELTGATRPVFLRVYLKKKTDFAGSKAMLKRMVGDLPVAYLLADICRDELMIEIEGISIA